ncbi:MAG: SMP-30/gluconolactonase/LRE family protein [Candidatus Zixiibacteriota bacterium]
MRFTALVTLLLVLASSAVIAQENELTYGEHQQKAAEAYRNQDYSLFVQHTASAIDINPHSLVSWYNLACGYALTGQTEGALRVLRGLAGDGIDFGAANDSDLESIRDTDEFRETMALLETKTYPICTSEVFYSSDQLDFLPEGIAYDDKTGRFFLGSMSHGSVVTVDSAGVWREFARLENDRLYSCLGLEVDRTRSILWAVGTVSAFIEDFDSADEGRTGVFGFDLESGDRKYLYMLPEIRSKYGFNDLTVSSGGDIYITGDALYRIKAGDELPAVLIPVGDVIGTNGITLSDDERLLFVADFAKGILSYDIATESWNWLGFPDTLTLTGFDGLYYYDNSLIGIQPTLYPWRVVQLYLDETYTEVIDYRVMERANPDLAGATTGAIVKGSFYYVATGHPPEELPDDIPISWHRNLGRTVIMKAPFDEAAGDFPSRHLSTDNPAHHHR